MAEIRVPEACCTAARLARERGFSFFLVGGAVRNTLLGLPCSDMDLCGPARPEELSGSFSDGPLRVLDTVNGLGTAMIRCTDDGSETVFEYTAFRKDSYAGDGAHAPGEVVFTKSMEEDAARRDFTMNALYADPITGEVLDPLGCGRTDLRDGVLRMVREDTMAEDALRILRLVRFAAQLAFGIDPGTYRAAKENVAKLARISPERIWKEFLGILLSDTAYGREDGPERGLFLLMDLGAFAYIFPELLQGRGMGQSPVYHAYDVMEHQLRACVAAPPDPVTRTAALLHDIAKPEVFHADGNMHRHPERGEQMARAALRRLHVENAFTDRVCELVREHMFDIDNSAHAPAVRRRILRLGKDQFARLADLREADFTGSGKGNPAHSADKWRAVLAEMDEKAAPFSLGDLAVNGTDLMRELSLAPGPEVGKMLDQLLQRAAARPAQNNYKSLIRYAKILKGGALSRGPARPDRMSSNGG